MTETDEDIVVTELFDFDVECGYMEECHEKAVWFVITKCCGLDNVFCNDHLMQLKEKHFILNICAHCHAAVRDFNEWAKVLPL